MEILRVENLTKVYGKGENEVRALDGVSFSVKRKRWIGIKRISTGMPSIASWFLSVLS